jgi:chemotaxis protein MotB
MSLVKDDPYAAVNRRISLVVLNLSTQRRIESENAAAADVSARDAREVGTAVDEARGAVQAATATKPGETEGNPSAEGVR